MSQTQTADRKPNPDLRAKGSSDSSDQEQQKREEEYEHQEVLHKSAASAHIVYRAILREAEEELERPSIALAWSGLAAGMSMGFSLVLIPYIVGLGGLSHIVIGSIYSIYTVAAHQHTWFEYFTHFAWPVLLGNCIGGVTLVAVVNYAQATAGSEGRGGGAKNVAD